MEDPEGLSIEGGGGLEWGVQENAEAHVNVNYFKAKHVITTWVKNWNVGNNPKASVCPLSGTKGIYIPAQFLHLLTSRKALQSFMVTSAPAD